MEEEDDVAVLDDVVFPFGAGLAGFFGFEPSWVGDHVIEGDDFSADEPFLDVGVDFPCCFLRGGPFEGGCLKDARP